MAHPVAIGVFFGFLPAAIHQDRRALFFRRGDQVLNALFGLRTDDWAEIGSFLETAVHGQVARTLRQLGGPVFGVANQHECRKRHASLSSGTEGCAGNGVESVVFVAIGKYGGVVLGSKVGLHALAVGAGALVDVLAGLVAADETDGLNTRFIEDEIHSACSAVNDIHYAGRETGLFN